MNQKIRKLIIGINLVIIPALISFFIATNSIHQKNTLSNLQPTPTVTPQVAGANTSGPISGTFISFAWSKTRGFTPEQWQKEFDDISGIGIKRVIVAGVHVANYAHLPATTYYNHLDEIFKNASENGMQVYISPADFNNYYTSTENHNQLLALSKKYSTEIVAKGYTNKPEFAGWYVQEEALLNVDYTDFSGWKTLADHYKSLTPGKKIITAPYYLAPCSPGRFRCDNQWWPNKTPEEMAENAKDFMQNTNIDIMAVQDGAGASGVTSSELQVYLPAMNKALNSIGKEFWVDAEIFRYTADHSTFIPANISSLTEQMNIVKSYPVVIWIYDFMSRQNDTASRELFNDYIKNYNITIPAKMYFYLLKEQACGQTMSKYTETTTCQTNLGLYMPGRTTGICYTTLTACQTANPKTTPTTTIKPTASPTLAVTPTQTPTITITAIPMYFYLHKEQVCGQTMAKYTETNTCQTNLGLYMPGRTTGICYTTLTACQTANPKTQSTTKQVTPTISLSNNSSAPLGTPTPTTIKTPTPTALVPTTTATPSLTPTPTTAPNSFTQVATKIFTQMTSLIKPTSSPTPTPSITITPTPNTPKIPSLIYTESQSVQQPAEQPPIPTLTNSAPPETPVVIQIISESTQKTVEVIQTTIANIKETITSYFENF